MRRRATTAVIAGLSTMGLVGAMSTSAAIAAGAPGSLDPSFGSGGKVLSSVGFRVIPSDAVLQTNGDVLVSLELEFGFAVARYLPSGALDPRFGKGGIAKAAFGTADGLNVIYAPTNAIALQRDGKIVEVGSVHADSGTGGSLEPAEVVRFNANGTLDQTFGAGGEVTTEFFSTPLSGAHEGANAVLVQPDGKILIGGEARQGQNRRAPLLGAIARYNSNGTLDTTFASGGKETLSSGAIGTLGLDAALDIFALHSSEAAQTELSPAGAVDAGVTPATISSSSVGGLRRLLRNDQSLFVASVPISPCSYRCRTKLQVQRFNANGGFDSSFASPLFRYTGATATEGADSANAVAIAPNGQIVVVGSHSSSTQQAFGVARLNEGGSLDATFGNQGVMTTGFQEFTAASAVVVQPDGKIISAGRSAQNSTGEEALALARYLG